MYGDAFWAKWMCSRTKREVENKDRRMRVADPRCCWRPDRDLDYSPEEGSHVHAVARHLEFANMTISACHGPRSMRGC
jgi:hypothetical protein